MAMWITAGLDDRFHWSSLMSPLAFVAGVAIAMLGSALIVWAIRSNPFFSSVVRIQKERGHSVISDGPYRIIRHPGYAGMSAFTLATPLILGSYWAFAPAGVTTAVTLLRIALEDQTWRVIPVTHVECDTSCYRGSGRSLTAPAVPRPRSPSRR